jgi:hypothetical protein
MSAGIMIGNPFTDVPEVLPGGRRDRGDAERAKEAALRLAQELWPLRHRMQGKPCPCTARSCRRRRSADR